MDCSKSERKTLGLFSCRLPGMRQLSKESLTFGSLRKFATARIRPKVYRHKEDKQGFTSITKPKMASKILMAFDFDKTLLDVNSDTFIMQALPDGGKEAKSYSNLQWTKYMQKVFDLLFQAGIKSQDILKLLDKMPFTTGMIELVKELKQRGHDSIIISDCNSFFIDHVLMKHGLQNHFDQVFTNPSRLDDQDHLIVSMYHEQTWCKLSAVNLCKGHVLQEYIDSKKLAGTDYKFVGYVGDGYNDFCPMLRLLEKDIAFPRIGYPCDRAIIEAKEKYKMKARVYPWKNGFEINNVLFQELKL